MLMGYKQPLITRKRFMEMFFRLIRKLRDPYYQGIAAELAFYFIMSMVPLIILLAQLLDVFSLSMGFLKDLINEYVSAEIAQSLYPYLDYTPSGTFSIFFVVFALWAASKAQFSMLCISNYAYTGRTLQRGYIKERLRAIRNIVLTMFMLVFSLLILVYGELILDAVELYVERIVHIQFNVGDIWYQLRWPMAMCIYFLTVSYNYYSLPAEKIKFRKIIPGSIAASVGMLLVTAGYSFYMSRIANYDLLYGGLASIVALLLWFYILGLVLVYGILINVVWEETDRRGYR